MPRGILALFPCHLKVMRNPALRALHSGALSTEDGRALTVRPGDPLVAKVLRDRDPQKMSRDET